MCSVPSGRAGRTGGQEYILKLATENQIDTH